MLGLSLCAVEAQAAGLRCLVSDSLAEETKITDRVRFLPLEEDVWESALAETETDSHRGRRDEEIAAHGYDIRSAAQKLVQVYERRSGI